jgi:hypothetical protein
MRASLLRRWSMVGVLATGLGLAAERTGLAAAAGVDVWNLPDLERRLAEHERVDARLEAECEQTLARIMMKEALVADLAAGRATLAGVTDRFQALNREHPETLAALRQIYRIRDPRELTARNVLDFVAQRPFPSPAARAAVTRRLAAEFARLFPAAGPPPA